jgi:hypothetical protein
MGAAGAGRLRPTCSRPASTTINDIWYAPHRLAETVEACGLRAQIAHKVFDVRLHELWRGDYTHHPDIGKERLRDGVAFAERWHGAADGRITARIGTHATDTCSAELLRTARAEANRLGIGMHIHAAQSVAEVEQIKAAHGCGPVEFLRDVGMLGRMSCSPISSSPRRLTSTRSSRAARPMPIARRSIRAAAAIRRSKTSWRAAFRPASPPTGC